MHVLIIGRKRRDLQGGPFYSMVYVQYLAPLESPCGRYPFRKLICEFDSMESAEQWAAELLNKYDKGTVKIHDTDGIIIKRLKKRDI